MQAAVNNNIQLGHSEVYLNEDAIVVVKGSDHVYGLTDVKELHAAIHQITNNKKCLVLLIASRFTLVDIQARDFLSKPESASNFIANAYVIKSLAQRILLNFVTMVKGTPIPSKFFTDEAAAVAWLKTFQ